MKKIILTSAFFLWLYTVNAQLTYTLVTTGLTAVTFENGPGDLEVGDVDGDGDLDIVTIGDHGSPNVNATEAGIMVFKNNGAGTSWSLSKSGNFGYGGVALGDVNNDGKMDIGYGMHHNYSTNDFGNQVLEVALGDGTGTAWTPYDDSLASTADGQSWGMFGTDFGDMNNDGLLDIASNAFGCCDGIWIYKNDGNGHWSVLDGNLGGNSDHACMMGDFNNDGNMDMATANEWGQVWRGTGSGTITPFQTGIPVSAFISFDIADVNNDGAKDIVIVDGGTVKVYTYNKTALTWQSISTGLPTTGIEGAALADMDMDGNCDLIIGTSSGLTIYKGDGAGTWTANGTIALTISQYNLNALTTGDFDHDGFTDIAILSKNGSSKNLLKVFLHTGTASVLNVLPVTPKGYECYVPGSVQFMHWLSSVPAGPSATVLIEFSSAGSGGPWTTVAASAPNSGVYQWVIPSVNSATCFLKYTITQGVNSQSVIISNAFGIGSCATPPPTGVNEVVNEISDLVTFPNPMSITGWVQFGLSSPSFVEIKLYDMVGKQISLISTGNFGAGDHKVSFDASAFEPGIYFVRVFGGKYETQSRKVMIMNNR